MNLRGLDALQKVRFALLVAALALTLVGILFVHSTTCNDELFPELFPSAMARKQIVKAFVALVAFFVVTRIDYRIIDRWSYAVYGTLAAVLSGMLVLKSTQFKSFVQLAFFQVQPSELMKVACILALARFLRFRDDQRAVRGLLKPLLLTAVPMGLVLLQPDLGTSLMFPPILLGMLYVSGARPRYIATAVVLAVLSVPATYYLGDRLPLLLKHQRERIEAFMGSEIKGRASDHLRESQIAIGSGGLWGKGLGEGTQNTLRFVPAKHTDFIFSIVGEEWGFAGTASVTVLFVAIVLLTLRVALLTREPFGRLAVTGVAMAFAAQSIENIGMTMGLTPITGVPLPFVSHGGSSLVTSYLALAVAFNVATRRVRVVATRDLAPEEAPRAVVVDGRRSALLDGEWPAR